MTQTKWGKNTKQSARKSGRSSPPPEGLRGARGAEPLASGNGKATIRAIYLGEQSKRRKEVKEKDLSEPNAGNSPEIRWAHKISTYAVLLERDELPALF